MALRRISDYGNTFDTLSIASAIAEGRLHMSFSLPLHYAPASHYRLRFISRLSQIFSESFFCSRDYFTPLARRCRRWLRHEGH